MVDVRGKGIFLTAVSEPELKDLPLVLVTNTRGSPRTGCPGPFELQECYLAEFAAGSNYFGSNI